MTLIEHRECSLCGAMLDVAPGTTVTVTFVGRSGRPNERVLAVAGREIHRCEVPQHA